MASWHVPAISDGSLTGPKYKDEQSTAEQHIALVEVRLGRAVQSLSLCSVRLCATCFQQQR